VVTRTEAPGLIVLQLPSDIIYTNLYQAIEVGDLLLSDARNIHLVIATNRGGEDRSRGGKSR
jgi:hypothetical protein